MNRIIIIALIGAFLAMLMPSADAHTRRYQRRAVVREVVYTAPAVRYSRSYGRNYYGYAPYGYGYGDPYGYGYPYGYGFGAGLPLLAFGFGGHHHHFSHHSRGGHHH